MPSPFSITQPDVGGSQGTWGTILNAAFEYIEDSLDEAYDLAAAALSKTGGVMTGRLDVKTATVARGDKGSASGSVIFDLSVAQYWTWVLSGASTLTFENAPAGSFATGLILRITDGGSAVITWPASVEWASGAVPVLTTAGVDVLVFISDDNGVTWRGFVSGLDLR